MSTHNLLSPSAWERWSKCPAAPHQEVVLEDTTSPAAQWGTESHALLEFMINNERQPEPADFDFDDFEAKRECALVAYDYAKGRQAALTPCSLRAEVFASPAPFTGIPGLAAGTADIVLASNGVLEIADLKTGVHIVDPSHRQLWIYALAVLGEYWPDQSEPCPFETVRITIVQPRASHPDGPVRFVEMTVALLLDFAPKLTAAIEATQVDNPPFVPGETQCRFCKYRGSCAAAANDTLAGVFPGTGGQVSQVLEAAVETHATLDQLTVEQQLAILEAEPMLLGLIKGVKQALTQRLQNREPVPGKKLVRGASKRKYLQDDTRTVAALTGTQKSGGLGLKRKEVVVEKPISFTKVEKMLKSDLQKKNFQALVGKGEGALIIVDETDERENAVPPLDFAPVEETPAELDLSFLA